MTRRSGFKIMKELILVLDHLKYTMLFAILNGTLGFLCAMGVTVSGAIYLAKCFGENISLSYNSIILITILCGVFRGILRYFEQYTNHYIAFKLLAVLRDKVFSALRRLSPAKLDNKQKGSIISMITSDIETLEVFYAHTISPICIAILVSSIVVVFVSIVSSIWLGFVAFIAYLIIGIFVPVYFSKQLKQSGVTYRNEFSSFNAYFLDSIKGIKDIVLNNASHIRKEEVNRRSDKLLNEMKNMRHEITKSMAITEWFVSMFILFTLFVGIVLVLNNLLTPGKMIIGVVTIFSSFGPVLAISALPGNLTQTFASADRILNLLKEQPVVEEIVKGKSFNFETLDINQLSFSYNHQEEVLKDVSMHVNKGEIIGIVGDSGCGKSTLLKLLLRFFEVSHGSILFNNININEIQTSNLLDNVTMVSQTTYLFDETIEENLKIAKQDATIEEIIEVCKMASIHDFISSLEEGYQTRVGSLGSRLSAGEKQRIGLARAFLSGSELILLDEPTSNVDSMNEGIILKALKDLKHKKTIILVSHRESTMAIADRIYHIKKGCMYESK